MYGKSGCRCIPFTGASCSAFRDRDRFWRLGEGVDIGEPFVEYCSTSSRTWRPPWLLPVRVAKTAAVAAAASSTVPV
jgi:hypothetical protein